MTAAENDHKTAVLRLDGSTGMHSATCIALRGLGMITGRMMMTPGAILILGKHKETVDIFLSKLDMYCSVLV